MNESFGPERTFEGEIDVSVTLELNGQKLCIDRKFEKVWESNWLKTEQIGWFVAQRGIVFAVDFMPHSENIFSFVHAQFETEQLNKLTALINAHPRQIESIKNDARVSVASLEKRARIKNQVHAARSNRDVPRP